MKIDVITETSPLVTLENATALADFVGPPHKPAPGKRLVEFDPDMMAIIEDAVAALANTGNMAQVEKLGFLALMLDPMDPRSDWWTALGLEASGNMPDALLAFETAIQKDPHCVHAHLGLGVMLVQEGKYKDALPHLQIVMALQPNHTRALQAYMLALLALGDLERGWNIYVRRNRFKRVDSIINKYPDSLRWWNGASKANVLLIGEEGFGERIMFSSMIPDAIAHGAKPTIEMVGECAKFAPLFRRSFPKCLIGTDDQSVPVNAKLHIGDLGALYRRNMTDFPKHTGYLKADRARTMEFRRRLSPGPIIGISWKSEGPSGRRKSIPLAAFNPIFRHFNCTFVDLQYGETEKERHACAPLLNHLPDLDLKNDVDGVASLVAACDLVITISNVTAHIAGGLGVPVWMLAPRARGLMWFWFAEREDSPWYPSMRIHRELDSGWDHVLHCMGNAVANRTWAAWKDDNTV